MRMVVSLDRVVSRLVAVLALAPLAATGCGKVVPCEGGTEVKGPGPTGFEVCEGGWAHRPSIVECTSPLPRATTCDGQAAGGNCTKDSDCTAQPNGYCQYSTGQLAGCLCNYGCTKDAECGQGEICVCGDPIGRCEKASCKSDADCGGDKLCATYVTNPGCGGEAFACQSPSDQCASDADCSDSDECALDGDHRVCAPRNCNIGRPFLVDGAARVAGVARRADWCARLLAPAMADLPADVRRELADEWTRTGQMEHASVAAFARFSMQLLALGAPPDLVMAAHQAALDETEHALACFALASGYAGEPVGPGPLAMDGALLEVDLAAVARLAILEGCIGETVAAVEAEEAAARAEDPAVRAALVKIAEDEARHAELAWRFVRWAMGRDAAVARAVAAVFDDEIADERARRVATPSAEDEGWLRHGVVRGALRAEIRHRVILGVVGPTAEILVEESLGVVVVPAAA